MVRKFRGLFDDRLLTARLLALVLAAFVLSMILPVDRANAACTVPNNISNGQTADATAVMDNFNSVANCADAAVTPSGTPSSGNIAVFSSTKSVTNGNLSGDCTTAGSLSITCTKTNGLSFRYYATGTDAAQLTGTVSPSRFNNGIDADATHFLRGDGVWATPQTGGGGGGGLPNGTPVIRASSIQSFNGSSVTISWPTGTITGDLVIIFVSDGYAINSPTGWAILNNTGGNDWSNGLTAAKLMTASDISAGSVTVTLVGPYNGVAAVAAVDGGTFNGIRETAAARPVGSGSYSSTALAGLFNALSTDTIIGFTYVRGAMNPSISNFTQLQLVNATNASALLGKYSASPSKLGISETATYPSGNNGFYWSMIALR